MDDMDMKRVSLVITGTILVYPQTEVIDVDKFTDDVAGLGMTIEDVEVYES